MPAREHQARLRTSESEFVSHAIKRPPDEYGRAPRGQPPKDSPPGSPSGRGENREEGRRTAHYQKLAAPDDAGHPGRDERRRTLRRSPDAVRAGMADRLRG